MKELNEWMVKQFGYSWDKHEQDLITDGYEGKDIADELLGLTYDFITQQKGVYT